jgi:hypothetical protein
LKKNVCNRPFPKVYNSRQAHDLTDDGKSPRLSVIPASTVKASDKVAVLIVIEDYNFTCNKKLNVGISFKAQSIILLESGENNTDFGFSLKD